LSVASLLVLSPGVISAAPPPALTFAPIQNLSNDSGLATSPVVASVNNGVHQYVYVAWMDETPGKFTTFFTVSVDGKAFGITREFTGLGGPANPNTSGVQMAASGQYVYLTWKQGKATAYATSSDNGGHFASGLLSSGTAPGQSSASPAGVMTAQAVATNGTSAYFTWSDDETATGNGTIQFVATHDGGAHFTSPVQINTGESGRHRAVEDELAAVGDYVYAVWDSIWFTSSALGGVGSTWQNPLFLKPASCVLPCIGREPMISANGTNVYVTFPMGGAHGVSSYSVEIAVSHNNGKTFAPAMDISGPTLTNTREDQVVSYGMDVYVTSRGTPMGSSTTEQYAYVSTDSGNTFSAPIALASPPLSGPENGIGGLALDHSNGDVYIQWVHGSLSQVYISESVDRGSTWSSAQQVSASVSGVIAMGDPHGGQGPMAAAYGGHVYVVWEDMTTGNGDIYFTST